MQVPYFCEGGKLQFVLEETTINLCLLVKVSE
jgi:hypothetical protein